MEIYHQYVRLRRHFGRHPAFAEEGAEMLADVRPNEEHATACVTRNPVAAAVQCVPEMSEHEANTVAVTFACKAVAHHEGGWPKDVDPGEAEHTVRYRRKVEKDEDYVRTVVALGAAVEGLVKQNNAIDIYEEYFAGLGADHRAEAPRARMLTLLKDAAGAARGVRRGVSCVSWAPDGGPRLVASYSILAFQQQPANTPACSYVWGLGDPTTPEAELAPPSQLVAARFNLKDSSVVGAGLYNGQFGLFDLRKGSGMADATPMDVCHRDPVFDFAWLQSKTGSEAMSVSTDGSVLWWDIRKLGEAVEGMPLRDKGGDGAPLLGGVCLEYDPAAGPTKFMVGTEQGAVLACNRRAKNPADRVSGSFLGHHGPVYSLRRSPFFPKFFLSVGDWTARLWSEDVRSPLLTSRFAPAYLTGGAWSPTRPGVFFAAQSDGVLAAYDLFYAHTDPSLQVQVSDAALTSLGVREDGATLAVGAADGTVAVLRLNAPLSELGQNEKQGVSAMLERETLRERNLEKAAKEARVKARREAQRHAELPDATTDDDLAALEAAFFRDTGLEGARGLSTLAARRAAAAAAAAGGEQAATAGGDAEARGGEAAATGGGDERGASSSSSSGGGSGGGSSSRQQ